jgi:hypothetical protein
VSTLDDGRQRWRDRHPQPVTERREYTAEEVQADPGLRGRALYARRRGNVSARRALIEAAGREADNVKFGDGPDAA